MIQSPHQHKLAQILLTLLVVIFMPVMSVRYATSNIVNCNGSDCPEMFSIVEQYSPLNYVLTKYVVHMKMPHVTILPVTYLAMIIALIASHVAISFFLRHRDRYHPNS